jgi:replicative DNA helicase
MLRSFWEKIVAKLPIQKQNKLRMGPSILTPDDLFPDFSIDNINNFGNRESLKKMITNVKDYDSMLAEQITFINTSLSSVIPFTRANLYLICAYTGNGKSTIAANISFPLWKEKKKILIISNEETDEDVVFRIACLDLNLSFNDWKKGNMSMDDKVKVTSLFQSITQYVKVIGVNAPNSMTTKIEGIQKALNDIKGQGFSAALIDYYQLASHSAADPSKSTYENLNELRKWLGMYIKTAEVPVVLFAQLYSIGKRAGKDLDNRMKECSHVIEPSTVVIEAVPNVEELTTDFIIHKDRFGHMGKKVTCAFEKGRFVKLTEDHKRRVTEMKLSNLTKSIDDMSIPVSAEQDSD